MIRNVKDIAELGFDYVELPLAPVMKLSGGQFDELLGELRKYRVPCECANVMFPGDIRLTGRDFSPEKVNAYLDSAAERAKKLGIEVVVFGSGGARRVPDGFPREAAFMQLAGMLKSASEKFEGITVAIEHLNEGETNIINSLDEVHELMCGVNAPNVKMLVDLYHFAFENKELSEIKKYAGDVAHVHIAEPAGREYPHTGNLSYYKEVFGVLKEMGYDGRISIEGRSEDFPTDAKNAMELFAAVR